MDVKKILGPQWAEMLPRADDLLEPVAETLKEQSRYIRIFPIPELRFKMFRELPPEKILVVILGQDPYHIPAGQATGRAFECGKFPSSSWKKIRDVYKTQGGVDSNVIRGRLDRWVQQGVFLTNKALTVREAMPGSHTKIWKSFMSYVMSVILTDISPKVFVVLGDEARKIIPRVGSPHNGLWYEHPVKASYMQRAWDVPDDLFHQINKFLEFYRGKTIKW